jgi:Holliday junction resolvasome RuvABC endonuclease subunit
MEKKSITILAVNPGTRHLAVAVFRGPELREWCIKVFKGKWSRAKLRAILSTVCDLIARYEVDGLAIKRLSPSRSSANLALLVSKLKTEAGKRRLPLSEYSIKQIENAFCPGEKGSRREMTEALVLEYPILWNEFEKERHHKNPYYGRLFEAVALGSLCQEEPDRTRLR